MRQIKIIFYIKLITKNIINKSYNSQFRINIKKPTFAPHHHCKLYIIYIMRLSGVVCPGVINGCVVRNHWCCRCLNRFLENVFMHFYNKLIILLSDFIP